MLFNRSGKSSGMTFTRSPDTSGTASSSPNTSFSTRWEVFEEFDLKTAVEFYRLKEAKIQKASTSSMSISRMETVKRVERRTKSELGQYKNGILFFKKLAIEIHFCNEHAVLHKKALVIGYAITVAMAVILVVLDNLFFMYENLVCGDDTPDVVFYCDTLFGPKEADRQNMFNFSYLFSVFGLNVLGVAVHFYIHQSERIQNKAWALVSANVVYLLEVILLIVLMVTLHSGDNFWPLKLMMWYMCLIMVSIWLTGFLFVQNLVLFLVGFCIYFPVTFGVATALDKNSQDQTVAQLDSLLTSSLYASTSHFIVFIHLSMLISSYMNERATRKRFFQRLMITLQQDRIILDKTKHGKLQKDLLFNMLPRTVVNQLEMQGYDTRSWEQLKVVSSRHQGVSIMFADIPQFDSFATAADPSSVMVYLNDLFELFDLLCDGYEVYKVETVADCYVAAVGVVTGNILNRKVSMSTFDEDLLTESQRNMAEPKSPATPSAMTHSPPGTSELIEAAEYNTGCLIEFSKAIIEQAQQVIQPILNTPTQIRVGVHTGPCMSGIVGTKNLRYCLFGDTMNTAARMQQNGLPNVIQASEVVQKLTPREQWEMRGMVEMKGKGTVKTWVLKPL